MYIRAGKVSEIVQDKGREVIHVLDKGSRVILVLNLRKEVN